MAPTSASPDASLHTTTLTVGGMTCAACQVNVQRALERRPGVRAATVNLITGEARVTHDPATATLSSLVTAVESAGYDATPLAPGSLAGVAFAERPEAEATGLHAAVSLTIAAVAMVLSMPTMTPHGGAHTGAHAGPVDPVMAWTDAHITPALARTVPWLYATPRQVLVLTLLALTIFVMGWAGRRFYTNGARALWHGLPDMNSLVAVGTGAAFLFSLVATFVPTPLAAAGIAPDVYYEAVITILAFVLTGRWLEGRARHRAVDALRGLAQLQPREAVVADAAGEHPQPIESVTAGQVVLVRPGMRVPLDGVITTGHADLDEASITGESLPVLKREGDAVTAGTRVTTGAIFVRVTATAGQDTLSRMVELMREAQLSRAPIQQLADRVSAVFVPGVIAVSALTLLAWLVFGGWAAAGHGIAAAVAVLIVACPCAMGLAVPTAVLTATGRGSALGLLVKGGDALQRLSTIRTVVFDKTGTLTEGVPAVVDVLAADADADDFLAKAAAVERLSEHPLARAIVAHAGGLAARGTAIDFEQEAGLGASATINGRRVRVGNREWLRRHGASLDRPQIAAFESRAQSVGATVVWVSEAPPDTQGVAPVGDVWLGAFALADAVRDTSAPAIAALTADGVRVALISGDRAETARAVGAAVGITDVAGNVLPVAKAAEIRRRREHGPVAMVGDGVNDAAALAGADIGFAMSSGTDIAIHAADVTLMRPDLRLVAAAIRLGRASLRVMQQNLFWALAYNVLAIPLAAGALYPAFGLLLSPTVASAAMALSSVSVVANSLRLRRVDLGLS